MAGTISDMIRRNNRGVHHDDFLIRRQHIEQERKTLECAVNKDRHLYLNTAWHNRPHSANHDVESGRRAQERESREASVEMRRSKLRTLLNAENRIYLEQLSSSQMTPQQRLELMRERTTRLKNNREDDRATFAAEKMRERFIRDCPELRAIESEMLREEAEEGRVEQILQQSAREVMESAKTRRFEENLEIEKELADKRAKEEAEERQRRNDLVAEALQEQMAELRSREAETRLLRNEQDRLLKEQWELEEMEAQRMKLKEETKRREFRAFLDKQVKSQMRRRNREAQEAIALDMKILEGLLAAEEDEDSAVLAHRRKQADEYRQFLEEFRAQSMEERRRQAEIDILYADEAEKLWEKRQEEWNREEELRERLMQEVLTARNEQVLDRIAVVAEERAESLREKDRLMRDLEFDQNMRNAEEKSRREVIDMQRSDLDVQTEQRRLDNIAERKRQQVELEMEAREEADYRRNVEEETRRMREMGPSRFHGTRRHAW